MINNSGSDSVKSISMQPSLKSLVEKEGSLYAAEGHLRAPGSNADLVSPTSLANDYNMKDSPEILDLDQEDADPEQEAKDVEEIDDDDDKDEDVEADEEEGEQE